MLDGFLNKSQVNYNELRRIVSSIKRKKIKGIDTAISYKNVDDLLGKIKISNLKIYSKIPKLPKNCKNVENWVENQVKKSKKYPKNIYSKDLGLIDPRRWPNA